MVSFQEVGVNRRSILQTVGTATIIGTGVTFLTGTATAHQFDEVVFCGCSQVCACGHGGASVIIAHETDEGFRWEETEVVSCCKVKEREDDCKGSDLPNCGSNDFEFCFEVDEGKIIAVTNDSDQAICNPNDPWNCAGEALEAKNFECTGTGQSGGPCGEAFLRSCGENNPANNRGGGRK